MSELNETAVSELNNTLQAMVNDGLDGGVNSSILLLPKKIKPAGIGGIVGVQAEPFGDILGVWISATAQVSIQSNNVSQLFQSISQLSSHMQSLDRKELIELGIQKLSIASIGDLVTGSNPNNNRREINFDVIYQYEQAPSESQQQITEVVLEPDLGLSGNAEFLINTGFDENALDLFDVVDDPQADQNTPSAWTVNIGDARIEQGSEIFGGTVDLASFNKPASYLVLRNEAGVKSSKNFIFDSELRSSQAQGIGVVFRWQDVDNFYFFLMSQQQNYRIFGKKEAGIFSALQIGGIDSENGYTLNQAHQLKIIVEDHRMVAMLDGEVILEGQDSGLSEAGQVGFMTHANDGAQFNRIKLTRFT